MMKASIYALMALVFFAPFAMADAPEQIAMDETVQADWLAVGRLTTARQDGPFLCSGTLIAPDLVLTAAHCVRRYIGRPPSRIRNLAFQSGWNGDDFFESASAVSLHVHPEWDNETLDVNKVRTDIALIRLAEPLAKTPPLPLVQWPGPGQLLAFAGFDKRDYGVPKLTQSCPHQFVRNFTVLMDCNVIGGNSGSGVFVGTPPDARTVAVVSARSGRNKALVAVPDAWVFGILNGDS